METLSLRDLALCGNVDGGRSATWIYTYCCTRSLGESYDINARSLSEGTPILDLRNKIFSIRFLPNVTVSPGYRRCIEDYGSVLPHKEERPSVESRFSSALGGEGLEPPSPSV